MSGFIKLGSVSPKIPAGFITSEECARRRGVADETLRANRARSSEPLPWFKHNGWRAIYREADVLAYLRGEAGKAAAKAAELAQRADAMLARVADIEESAS